MKITGAAAYTARLASHSQQSSATRRLLQDVTVGSGSGSNSPPTSAPTDTFCPVFGVAGDCSGNDIQTGLSGQTLDECRAFCATLATCTHFVYWPTPSATSGRNCFVKTQCDTRTDRTEDPMAYYLSCSTDAPTSATPEPTPDSAPMPTYEPTPTNAGSASLCCLAVLAHSVP